MKIGLVGAHGVGKTTVYKGVVERMPWVGQVSEAARRCPHAINERAGFEAQEWIFREQVREETKYPLDKVILCDRTTLDQMAYVDYAFHVGNMTYEQHLYLTRHLTAWADTYDIFVYYPIRFPLSADDKRSGNKGFQKFIDVQVQEHMKMMGGSIAGKIIHEDEQDTMNRVERIVNLIQEQTF